MATHHPIRKTVAPPAPVIPDKLYFRIGDVARLCEVPAYVLRFWETEFPNLKPNKGGTGQRLYRRKEVETALRIKHLLYDLGYTIPGARQVFKNDAKPEHRPAPAATVEAPESPAAEAATNPQVAERPVFLGSGARRPDDASAQSGAHLRQLHALRDDLRALYAQLSAPSATDASEAPLRPRLVAEPRRARLHMHRLELEPRLGPIPLVGQQDLFPPE